MSYELAPGRVLHFNDTSWDRLVQVLREKHLDLMAEHVQEQRQKRPVVLDLAYPKHVATLLRSSATGHVLQDLADQIEAQTKPPRIPEPGLFGIVEATVHGDEMPRFYIRDSWADEGPLWVALGGSRREEWDDLIDPVLIREGVTA